MFSGWYKEKMAIGQLMFEIDNQSDRSNILKEINNYLDGVALHASVEFLDGYPVFIELDFSLELVNVPLALPKVFRCHG